ncbi:MAG: tetratricopeptide repeat protein [Rhodospirillaceae bacterium]
MPQQRLAADISGAAGSGVSVDVGSSASGNYLAGQHAVRERDFGAAADMLERALQSTPDDEELRRRAFLAKLSEGDVAGSLELAKLIMERETAEPIAGLVVIVDAIKSGDLARASMEIERYPDRGFSGFVKPLLFAWAEVAQGRTEAAIAALQPLSRQAGLTVLYELHSALISDVAGNSAAAVEHYQRAAEAAPRATLRVVQGLGRHYEIAGESEKATALYRTYIAENPESVVLEPALARIEKGEKPGLLVSNAAEGIAETLFDIASTMTRDNSAQLALIYGRLAMYLRPDFDLAQMLVAGILESLQRYDDAIAVYRQIRPASSLHWSARLRIAGNLEASERDEEAIKLLEELTREDPRRPDAYVTLGDLYRSNKQFESAVDAYDLAIKTTGAIDQRHWTILYSRGIALERARQWERAERDFERALELNPEQPYVLNYLGYSWVDQGINLDRARDMIERAVELRPNDGYIVDSLGWALYRMNDFGGAVEKLERAVELRPEDPTINDHLGDAYWRVGRHNEARFQWQRALALKPEPEAVAAIETKIEKGLPQVRQSGKDG